MKPGDILDSYSFCKEHRNLSNDELREALNGNKEAIAKVISAYVSWSQLGKEIPNLLLQRTEESK